MEIALRIYILPNYNFEYWHQFFISLGNNQYRHQRIPFQTHISPVSPTYGIVMNAPKAVDRIGLAWIKRPCCVDHETTVWHRFIASTSKLKEPCWSWNYHVTSFCSLAGDLFKFWRHQSEFSVRQKFPIILQLPRHHFSSFRSWNYHVTSFCSLAGIFLNFGATRVWIFSETKFKSPRHHFSSFAHAWIWIKSIF